VKLLVADEMHLVGGGGQGPTLEVVVSRTRYIANQLQEAAASDDKAKRGARIVGLSASLANAKDVGDWMGASGHGLFAFHPQVGGIKMGGSQRCVDC
jgi:pre-mRNA-splicing helicase BRR2